MQVKLNVIVGAVVAMCAVAASAQETVVKIGHVAPMSGGQAHYGKDNENGARMAVEDLNAKGVVVGGKKVKLELVAEDDAADPKQGTAVATKLCDAKVQGVVGHLNSGTTIPASKVYNDCGLPMITGAATNPKLTQQGFKNVYRIIANDNALGAGLALHAANNLKVKTVAIVDDRTAYGQGVAEVFKKTAMAKGIQVVDEQYTNDGSCSLRRPSAPPPTCRPPRPPSPKRAPRRWRLVRAALCGRSTPSAPAWPPNWATRPKRRPPWRPPAPHWPSLWLT